MNEYEENIKIKRATNKAAAVIISKRIEENRNKLDTTEAIISSLESVINAMGDTDVITALERQINISKKKHADLVLCQEDDIELLKKNRTSLLALQDLCPHENSKVVGYNRHHNYYVHKCDLCGKEF